MKIWRPKETEWKEWEITGKSFAYTMLVEFVTVLFWIYVFIWVGGLIAVDVFATIQEKYDITVTKKI